MHGFLVGLEKDVNGLGLLDREAGGLSGAMDMMDANEGEIQVVRR